MNKRGGKFTFLLTTPKKGGKTPKTENSETVPPRRSSRIANKRVEKENGYHYPSETKVEVKEVDISDFDSDPSGSTLLSSTVLENTRSETITTTLANISRNISGIDQLIQESLNMVLDDNQAGVAAGAGRNGPVAQPQVPIAPIAGQVVTIKDALGMVPKFDGSNIPLSHFLEGCNEAREMVDRTAEPALTRLVRSKIEGEARSSIHGQSFNTIQELKDYLKQIYAPVKTVHQLMGELGYEFQRDNEKVITFYNRIRDLGSRIVEAERVRAGVASEEFLNNTRASLIDCFKRGLKNEVEQRLPANLNIEDLLRQAIKIEKELEAQKELRKTSSRGPVNINQGVLPKRNVYICQLCKEEGHEASTCSRSKTCTYCHKVGHIEERCNLKRQQQVTCQLCDQLGHLALSCPTITKCQLCNKIGHVAKNCEQIATPKIQCQVCQENGHSAKECPKLKKSNPREGVQESRPALMCQYCNKTGHTATYCWLNPENANPNACRNCRNPNHTTDNCPRRRPINENWRTGNDQGAPPMSARTEAPKGQTRSTNMVMYSQESLELLPLMDDL